MMNGEVNVVAAVDIMPTAWNVSYANKPTS